MLTLLTLSKHNYLIYKNKQYKSCHLKLYKIQTLENLQYRKVYRSSHQVVFCKKGVLRNFAKFTGKCLCLSLRTATLFKKETLTQVFSREFCKISNNTYSYRKPPVAASECRRNLEFEKRTDQNFIIQNLCHGEECYISKKKKLLKQCQKEVIYEYILAFAWWWLIFWEVVGSSGGYSLAGGWCWWVYFGWWWVVVDGGGWCHS